MTQDSFSPSLPGKHSRPIDWMFAHLGVRETAPNRGPWIDECLRFVGLNPANGYPWCAASLVWCAYQGGVRLKKTASVGALWRWAVANGRSLKDPEVGCAFVHLRPDGKGHCGIVSSLDWYHGTIGTISGNTNEEGSREGTRVGLHDKPPEYFTGFFHLRPDAEPLA